MRPSTRTSVSIAACLLAVLFVAGPGVAGLQAADATSESQPQAAPNLELPERVVLPGEQTAGSGVVGLDSAAAVDRGGTRLDGAYDRYLLEARLEEAESDAARRSLLNETVADVNDSVRALAERERDARRAYRSGEIDEAAFLSELRAINDEATELEQLAEDVDPFNARSQGYVDVYAATNASNELGTLWGDVLARQGQVREQVGAAATGDRPSQRIYVATTQNGTVLSTISDGTYHREAVRDDLLVNGSERGIGPSEFGDLATQELYPVLHSNYDLSSVGQGVAGQLYLLLAEGSYYEHGAVRSYVDAVSENAFWEYQRMELDDDLPVGSPITTTNESVTVSVQPTYATGPAAVTVTRSGSAVSGAPVAVNGTVVGETNADGRAWVVLPDGAPEVSVTVDGETVPVPIEWTADGPVRGGNRTSP